MCEIVLKRIIHYISKKYGCVYDITLSIVPHLNPYRLLYIASCEVQVCINCSSIRQMNPHDFTSSRPVNKAIDLHYVMDVITG